MWKYFFTRGQMSNQCYVSEFVELDEGILEFFFYEDSNQTENFIEMKTRNDIYYMGEKHY